MGERFVPLATYLRARATSPSHAAIAAEGASDPACVVARPPDVLATAIVGPDVAEFAHAEIVADLTLMRLATMEAFEGRARRLIAELADEVLARELTLAPAEIETLVARALAALDGEEPVALAVSDLDRARLRTSLPVRSDATLQAGDLVVHVRDGAYISSFAFRLADALARGVQGEPR